MWAPGDHELLVAQGGGWIDLCCPPGGNPAGHEADDQEKKGYRCEGEGIVGRNAPKLADKDSGQSKARGQLAPWRIIDCIEAACTRPKDEAFQLERDWYNECRNSAQRKALARLRPRPTGRQLPRQYRRWRPQSKLRCAI